MKLANALINLLLPWRKSFQSSAMPPRLRFGAHVPRQCRPTHLLKNCLEICRDEPEVIEMPDSVTVDVVDNGGPKEQTVLYWAAPKAYLGQKIGSYGGKLRFSTSAEVENAGGGRGDNSIGTGEAPGRLSNPGPTVILEEGRGLVIEWTDARSETGQHEVELIESNFVHQESGMS